jgi:2-polyprenyl-6-methoxyphenol hydroxylase-like FAD-dependent oxidoreductase
VQIQTGREVNSLGELKGFDLRVIADGAHSHLRGQTDLRFKDTLYPWGAVWAVLPDPQRHYGSTLWQWYRQANQMLGIMPTGLPADETTPVVSLFWSLRNDRHAEFLSAGLGAWKASVLRLNPACAPLLSHITRIEQLTWARYRDVVMPRYHTDDTVVIGDAAHATSPQLGQGTNLALLDAIALDQCLHAGNAVAAALAAYNAARRGHLHFYSQASRVLTPIFQGDGVVLPWLRDQFMAQSAGWPVMRGVNLQTLVGVRKGWLGGALPVATN